MWATLALTAALTLTPNQTGGLTFANIRATHGTLGHARDTNKVLPGDIYYVAFDVIGLKERPDGLVRYNMSMEVFNAAGKSQYKSKSADLEVVNSLGGNRLPAFAQAVIGTDTPPGEYTMKVTIKDLAANTSETLTHKFEVVRPEFGIVRIDLTYDAKGEQPAPPVAVPGQALVLNFYLANFDIDDKTGNADLSVTVRILDSTGKPTKEKPSTGTIKQLPESIQKVKVVPQQIFLQLNRSGKYTVELNATDNRTKKTTKHVMGLNVITVK